MANSENWITYHRLSCYCTNNTTTDAFIVLFEAMIQLLPDDDCKCRTHALLYYKENPIHKYRGYKDLEGREVGIFYWLWKFHNNVNKRLGHPLMTWNEAIATYYPSTTECESTCSRSSHK